MEAIEETNNKNKNLADLVVVPQQAFAEIRKAKNWFKITVEPVG